MARISLPLAGIRVLDLSRLLPGAFCTHILRELGAEVTKVEPPGGDPLRRLAPLKDGESVFHHMLNEGKTSLTLDLRMGEARARLRALIDEHDVLVDNFRSSTAKRLKLDPDSVRAAHPRVIHCSITGYGHRTANADRAGHDLNFVAEAGLLSFDVTGRHAPALPRMFIADVGGGAMSAVIGILAALVRRAKSGEGGFLDISMHHASLYWLMLPAARLLVSGTPPDAPDLPTDGSHACYNVYQCADGRWLALGALEEHFFARFAERLGHAEWAPRQFDRAAQPAMIAAVRAILQGQERDAWLAHFADLDICLSPVREPREALQAAADLLEGAVVRPPWQV